MLLRVKNPAEQSKTCASCNKDLLSVQANRRPRCLAYSAPLGIVQALLSITEVQIRQAVHGDLMHCALQS